MINQELVKRLEEDEVDPACGLAFLFVTAYYDYNTTLSFLERGILTEEEENIIKIRYLQRTSDGYDEHFTLKYPLFKIPEDRILSLRDKLIATGLTSSGHPDNPQRWSVLDFDDKLSTALTLFTSKLEGDLDIDRLTKVIFEYYRSTESAKKLSGYLEGSAITDYLAFKDKTDIRNRIL